MRYNDSQAFHGSCGSLSDQEFHDSIDDVSYHSNGANTGQPITMHVL